MKLLHWNVHMWRDATGADNQQAVADLVRQVSPDVVSLVEVDEPWGHPVGLHTLASAFGYSWVFVPAFEYRGQGGFGNALLSRTSFRGVQQWHLLPPRLYDGTEASEPRAVLLAEVAADGQMFWVGSTHLPREVPTMRTEASNRLRDLLARVPRPWVLCGDFNQPPSAWLPASIEVAPTSALPTYPTSAPTEVVDYCVLGGATGAAEVIQSTASDHLPLLIDVDTSNAGLVA